MYSGPRVASVAGAADGSVVITYGIGATDGKGAFFFSSFCVLFLRGVYAVASRSGVAEKHMLLFLPVVYIACVAAPACAMCE